MLKAGKTNTTRPYCLIFEIFRGGIPEGCARFVATPLWGMEDAWVQSYIYIGMKPAAPFSATPPYARLLCLGSVQAHTLRTQAGAGP